jgi:hypothetical protein
MGYNRLIQNNLEVGFILEILWKVLRIAARALGLWFLRWRNLRSYFPSRWSVMSDPSAAE